MRKIALLTSLLILVSWSTVWSADLKIGVYDLKVVLANSEASKDLKEELDKKLEPMMQERDKKKQELMDLQKEIEAQKMMLSQEAKEKKSIEINRKIEDYRRLETNLRKEAVEGNRANLEEIQTVLRDAIKEYGKKNNFTVIMDSLSAHYWNDSVDITEPIVAELNRVWQSQNQ